MSFVKMKRLRLFGMRSDREELLKLLQHMGCVEIDEPADKLADPEWAGLARPDSRALSAAREAQVSVQAALGVLGGGLGGFGDHVDSFDDGTRFGGLHREDTAGFAAVFASEDVDSVTLLDVQFAHNGWCFHYC